MSDKEEMLNAVIKATLKTYDFKTDKVIFMRSSLKDNKDIERVLQNYNLGNYDVFFVNDEYFDNENEYAIIIDKRYF